MQEEQTYIYCKKCGRKLKDKKSQKLGYGPCCFKQMKPKNKKIVKD